jgi:hypothetical protein
MFWSVGWPLLRAEGFFYNLNILYWGLGIGKLQFLVIKALDPYWIRIRIRIGLQPQTLDPDPEKWVQIHNPVLNTGLNVIILLSVCRLTIPAERFGAQVRYFFIYFYTRDCSISLALKKSAGCSILRAEGFSCSLTSLCSLGISQLQFFIKKTKQKFSLFCSIFGHQNPESGSGFTWNPGSESGFNEFGSTTLFITFRKPAV